MFSYGTLWLLQEILFIASIFSCVSSCFDTPECGISIERRLGTVLYRPWSRNIRNRYLALAEVSPSSKIVFLASVNYDSDQDILYTENCMLRAEQQDQGRSSTSTTAWAMGLHFPTVFNSSGTQWISSGEWRDNLP